MPENLNCSHIDKPKIKQGVKRSDEDKSVLEFKTLNQRQYW